MKLFGLEVTGSLNTTGNISGSVTSTGSFGVGFIDNKLGIGTTSPEQKLHIKETDSSFSNTCLKRN